MPDYRQQEYEDVELRRRQRASSSQGIQQATLVTVFALFLVKVTGFLREILIVPKFGYGLLSDAYIFSFQLPDLLYELLIGGAVAAVVTPTLAHGLQRGRERQTWHSVNTFATVFLTAMAIILVLTFLLTPVLSPALMTKGPDGEMPDLYQMMDLVTPVTRILLLQTFIMVLISLTNGVLQAYRRYAPAAFGVVIYNIAYMVGLIVFGAPTEEAVKKVAWSVVLSAILYFMFASFSARRELIRFRPTFDLQDRGFQRLLRLAIPTLLSGSVLHINSIIMNKFATPLAGAVTSLRQSTMCWTLPYGILAVGIGNVMLPNLSAFIAAKDAKKVRSLYTRSLRKALYYVTPFALSFWVLNFETVQAIFQWNAAFYTNPEVAFTGSIMRWFCISMVAHTVIFLTNQGFFSRRITQLTLFTGIFTLILNPIFILLYTRVFDFGLQGIAMAHASYSVLSAFILFYIYKRHRPQYRPYRMIPFFVRLVIPSALMLLVLYALRGLPLAPSHKFLQLVLYGLKLLVAFFAYYVGGLAINFREAKNLQKQIRHYLNLPPIDQADLPPVL